MKTLLSIILVTLILTSCDNQESKSQSEKQVNSDTNALEGTNRQPKKDHKLKVDKVYIGMTIKEMKDTYQDSEFIEEPVYEYGIDGESFGIVVKRKNERLFFVWTLQGQDNIHGITILSDSLTIDKNVHVGMSLNDFMEKYPNATVNIDMVDNRYEFLFVPELNYRVEFLTTDSNRVAEYDYEQPEPEFKEIKRPNATIDRISIN
jgi:hypothetical protein